MTKALRVRVSRGALVISIPITTLAFAAENCPALEVFNDAKNAFERPRVTNAVTLARAVLVELEEEDEAGGTPIHRLLDAAVIAAIENGTDGVEMP